MGRQIRVARQLLGLLGVHAHVGQGLHELAPPLVEVHRPDEFSFREQLKPARRILCGAQRVENINRDVCIGCVVRDECGLQVTAHGLGMADACLFVAKARLVIYASPLATERWENVPCRRFARAVS